MEPTRSADSLRLGVIRAAGPDAGEFLRAQLSNDVFRLGPDRHFLAAWCDAKGRTQLVARVASIDDAFVLIVPRELIDPALRRLRMFVLRLQVELTDASADYRISGTHDDRATPTVNRAERRDERLLLGLPGSEAHAGRALVLTPSGQAIPSENDGIPADSDQWALSDIDAGVAQITRATQGAFVPQMLNLHWLLAVDFDKGCYPGQEVIARLHYRGRLTRRVFRLAWAGRRPAPGASIKIGGHTVGTVLQAAGAKSGRLLAVVRVDAAAGQALETADGGALQLCDLPYATP